MRVARPDLSLLQTRWLPPNNDSWCRTPSDRYGWTVASATESGGETGDAARQLPKPVRTLLGILHDATASPGRPPRATQDRSPRIKAPLSYRELLPVGEETKVYD